MINVMNSDGSAKPVGLYHWQVKHGVHDDDPMYEIGSLHFSLLAQLPNHIASMTKEREELAKQHEKQMDDTHDIADSFTGARQNLEDIVCRAERLLYHLRAIEQQLGDITTTIAGKIDYAAIAKPLDRRIQEICANLPLDHVNRQVELLVHAGTRIELAAGKMERAAIAIEEYKDSKVHFYTAVMGVVAAITILALTLYMIVGLPHLLPQPKTTQATNAVVVPSITTETATQ